MNVSFRIRRLSCVAAAAALLSGVGLARDAAGQTPTWTLGTLHVGDCKVDVMIEMPRGGDRVGVVVDQTFLQEKVVAAGQKTMTFALVEPLRPGSTVVVRVNGVEANDSDGKPLRVQLGKDASKGGTAEPCEAEAEPDDDSPFDASAFIGKAVDNFAPDNVGAYRNPGAGSSQATKWVFGFNFDYRVFGRSNSQFQVWLEGETMHGVRTADINCAPPDPADKPPVCGDPTPQNVVQQARFILENATSVEAWISPRVEFMTLQLGTDTPARVYGTVNVGFVALRDAPKVFRTHHLGGGFVASEGAFEDSYLEVGWGKNELFGEKGSRFKVAGGLSFSIEKLLPVWAEMGRVFVEMTLDNDFGEDADSVRTFFGIDIDLKGLSQ
jgi:hypothetical protein